MHSTIDIKDTVDVYVHCVLCRTGGIIKEYCKGDLEHIDIEDGDFSRVIAAVICYDCMDERKYNREIAYYINSGIPLQYVLCTLVSHNAHRDFTGDVCIATENDVVLVVDICTLTKHVSSTQQLHNLEFDDGRLFEEEGDWNFFGVEGLRDRRRQ